MGKFAADTTVSADKSRAEIERNLTRYGATGRRSKAGSPSSRMNSWRISSCRTARRSANMPAR